MRLLFAGTPEVAVPSLLRLLKSEHELVAVLTQPARPRGRSSALVPSAVAKVAQDAGIPLLTPTRVFDSAAEIAELDVDLAVVVAYGQLIPAELLTLPRLGWINLHFSLLPLWRGAAPVQRAVIAGDTVTGASVFQLEAGMDTGPVYGSFTTEIADNETAGELLERLSLEGAALLAQCVDGIATGQLVAVAQQHDLATFAPKLDSAQAQVRWREPALAIERLIRGCTPVPSAWTWADGKRLELAPVKSATEVDFTLAPGELLMGKRSVYVGTGSHPVLLTQVKPAGSKWMLAADWARGLREPISHFTDMLPASDGAAKSD